MPRQQQRIARIIRAHLELLQRSRQIRLRILQRQKRPAVRQRVLLQQTRSTQRLNRKRRKLVIPGRIRQRPGHLAYPQPKRRLLQIRRRLIEPTQEPRGHLCLRGVQLAGLVYLGEDGRDAHAAVDTRGVLRRAGDDEVVAEEIVVPCLRGDDALLGGELFGRGDVGDAQVGFAGLEVFDCECGVAENLGNVSRGWDDGLWKLGGWTQPMVKGWDPFAKLSWMKASASTAVSVSQ